jgi:endogenous inhibitor of DNA gyrase (YacG/DUF329 family)
MARMDRPALCVQCRAHAVDPRWRPFCGRRCQTLDQARWADEAYRVNGQTAPLPHSPDADHTDG